MHKQRGVSGVRYATSDAHEGPKRAIEEVFPGSSWQRCIFHLGKNASACGQTKQKKDAIRAILHAVFTEKDPELVRELYHLACAEIEKLHPKAADTNTPAATYFGTAHEYAEKIIHLVLADHPITPRKAANHTVKSNH